MKLSRSSASSTFFSGLAGMFDVNLIQPFLQLQRFLRVDHDIRRLPLIPARRLMHHDAAVGQRKAHALFAGRQQEANPC